MLGFSLITWKVKNEHAVKKLPFIIRYASDWYKTQEMYDEAILKDSRTLKGLLLTATKVKKSLW